MRVILLSALFAAAEAQPALGKSTYAMSHPFAYKDFMEAHFPTAENMVRANDTSSCVEWVKLCIDDGHMSSCDGAHGNFQMHSVGAYERESGSKHMEELELDFTKAFGTMAKYDPYFEYHMAFLTEGLDSYVSDFKAAGVPYFASTFTDPATQKDYSSILVQIPGSLGSGAKSLLAMELLGESSSLQADFGVHRHELPRASPAGLARAGARLAAAPRKLGSNGKPVLSPIHVSFASSDLERDVQWFEGVLKGSKVYEGASDAEGKVYMGVVESGDVTEVRYLQSTLQTHGPTTVAAWEQYQVALHAQCFDSANNEGFDRLADNHFGHALGQVDLSPYIKAQQDAGLPYRFYGMGMQHFFYMYAPNGWGTQIIGQCSGCPTGGYNMCTQGITGHCSKDGGSAVAV